MTEQPAASRDGWSGLQVSGNGASANAGSTALIDIIDNIEVPIVVIRRDLTVGSFNRAAADALGLSREDIGRALPDILAFSSLPQLPQCCAAVITGGVESRIDFREGEASFAVRVSPYRSGAEKPAGIVLTFTNLSAFRAAIDQAVYERECTRAILNTVADPLVVVGADQRVQSGNRSFYTTFGVSPDPTESPSLYELGNRAFDSPPVRTQLQGAVAALSLETLREVLADPHAFQPLEVDHVITTKGPRTFIVDCRPLSFPGHSERRALVRFQDITARKQAEAAKDQRSEEELRRSEAFLAEGQRLSSTGSFSWKAAGEEMNWSEQLYRIYDIEFDLPVTLDSLRARVHPDDLALLEHVFQQARDGMNDLEWHYRLVMPDRSTKYLHAVARMNRDQDGELEYIAAVQDVTARRVSEDALAKARSKLANVARVTSLGVLTAAIAHEVNQPLSGIITNASTCLRMLDADPPNLDGARETARRTIRDGIRGSDVITRLRALFSRDAYTLEPLDLNELTREVIALTFTEVQRNGILLQSDLADDVPAIIGDRIQLQQVILNLLRNASESMLEVHDRPRHLVVTTRRDAGDTVRLTVRDTGVGVEPENIHKLLEAFYTTKSDGMGIGLSVSLSIVERHHGRLWMEPNDGPGATVSFSIPSRATGISDSRPRFGANG